MLVYFVLFLYLLAIFWVVNNRKIRNTGWLVTITFVLLFFIAGFRHYTVGSDAISYVAIFQNKMALPPLSEYFSSRFELGFLYLNDFIYNYISTNYSIYLAIYSFFTLLITFYVLKKESKDFYLSLIIYYTMGIYTWTMNNIRASLAMSLVYGAYLLMKNHKNIRAALLILVASAFHLSALAFLIIFFFRKVKLGAFRITIIAFGTIIGYLSARSLIENIFNIFDRYKSYLDSEWYIDSAKLGVILGFMILLVVFLFGEYVFKKTTLNESENLLRNIMIIATALSFISIQTVLLERFSLYFANFIVLYIPLIVHKMRVTSYSEQQKKRIIVLILLVLFGLRFFILLIFKPEWNVIVPYSNTLIDYLSGIEIGF